MNWIIYFCVGCIVYYLFVSNIIANIFINAIPNLLMPLFHFPYLSSTPVKTNRKTDRLIGFVHKIFATTTAFVKTTATEPKICLANQ
jgi:hypothetical protein